MTHENPRDPRQELQDRLIDISLREAVGGESAGPVNIESAAPTPATVTQSRNSQSQVPSRKTGFLIAATSAALLAIVALLAFSQQGVQTAVLENEVYEGGQTLPSGYYIDDNVQYHSPGEVTLSYSGEITDLELDTIRSSVGSTSTYFEDGRAMNRYRFGGELFYDLGGDGLSGRGPQGQAALQGGRGESPRYYADEFDSRAALVNRLSTLDSTASMGPADLPSPEPAPGRVLSPGDPTDAAPGNEHPPVGETLSGSPENVEKDAKVPTKGRLDFLGDLSRHDEVLKRVEKVEETERNELAILPLAIDARQKQAEQYQRYEDRVVADIQDLKRIIQSQATPIAEDQLQQQLEEMNEQQKVLAERRELLTTEVANLKAVAEKLDIQETPPSSKEKVSGNVLRLHESHVVEFKVDGETKPKLGDALDIYGGDEYWGRIEVFKIGKESIVGRVISKVEGRALPADAKVTSNLDGLPQKKKTWRRAKATPNSSRLMVGDRDELTPQGVQANVMVDGFRARVVLDYYFFNDRNQQLEGAFKLRLPSDASLFYFAFGETRHEYKPNVDSLVSTGMIDSALAKSSGFEPESILEPRRDSLSSVKEARIVPREKAAYAYQDMTRQRIDPALVEWSGAGMFNAKVFPLAPGKLHRIVVGYDVNLAHDNDDLLYQLDLPTDMGELHVDLNVAAGPQWKLTIEPKVEPVTLNGRSYYHLAEPKAETVKLRFEKPGVTLLTNADKETGEYFAIEATPEFPADETRASASHGLFLLDTSLSNQPERFNRYLDLMAATLKNNREELTHFNVMVFNVETHWWKNEYVANTANNVAGLRKYCETLALEGATDLRAALAEAASPKWAEKDAPPADLFLLSDGATTWGETNLHLVGKALKGANIGSLFAYKTSIAGESTHTLEHLTRQTGGAVFSVANDEEIAAASTAHRQRPWRLESVAVAGGADVMIAGRPAVIYPGQRLMIVGRGKPQLDSAVTLSVSRGDVKHTSRVQVDQVVESELATRVYGYVAVGQLEDFMQTKGEIAEAYARHFLVAGKSCSLLMLETEEDYLKYDIKPQEDAFVVKSTPAAELIVETLKEMGDRLEDPKAATLHLLKRLTEVPGFTFKTPAALEIALKQMPVESFAVTSRPLECEVRTRVAIPQAYRSQLADKPTELPYDLAVAEAERRLKVYGAGDGLKALSSLVENNPGDVVMLRDVAYTAIGWKRGDHAYPLLHRAAVARPFEPQGWLSLAGSLADMNRADLAIVFYEVTLAGQWDSRHGEIHKIAAVEYLRFLRKIAAGEIKCTVTDFAKSREATLSKQFDMQGTDLLVTMAWNTDRTDIDLHVAEPTGEVCAYDHPDTKIGGHITSDVTTGYGPEMYTLPNAKHGDYEVRIHYFGADRSRLSTRTKVTLTVYRNFGEKGEQVTRKTVALSNQDQTITIQKLKIEK